MTQCRTKDVAAAPAEGARRWVIQSNDPRITLVAGGYPLFVDGKIVGASVWAALRDNRIARLPNTWWELSKSGRRDKGSERQIRDRCPLYDVNRLGILPPCPSFKGRNKVVGAVTLFQVRFNRFCHYVVSAARCVASDERIEWIPLPDTGARAAMVRRMG